MDKSRKSKRHNNRNNNDRDRNGDKNRNRNGRDRDRENRRDRSHDSSEQILSKAGKKHFHPTRSVTPEQIRNDEEAIKAFKSSNQITCPKCQKLILDMASAMTDKASGQLMHFDCALETVQSQEKLGPGEKIIYIGQGRFGVLYFENIHDIKHFQIRRIIETEDRENRAEYRNQMADLFSQVK